MWTNETEEKKKQQPSLTFTINTGSKPSWSMPVQHRSSAKASNVAQPPVASMFGVNWSHLFLVVGSSQSLCYIRLGDVPVYSVSCKFAYSHCHASHSVGLFTGVMVTKDRIMTMKHYRFTVWVKKNFIQPKHWNVLCGAEQTYFPSRGNNVLCLETELPWRVMSIYCKVYSGAHSFALYSFWMKPSTWPSLLSTHPFFFMSRLECRRFPPSCP